MFWTTSAYAMGASGQAAQDGGGALASFAPLILMFAVFYFLLIRPQQKRAKEHRAMLAAIKRGDKVVTSGGLYGRVVEVSDDTLVIDLGETKVTVGRSFVSGVALDPKAAASKKDQKKGAAEPKAEQASEEKKDENK